MFWNTPPVSFGNLRFYAWAAVAMIVMILAGYGLVYLVGQRPISPNLQYRVSPAHHSDAPTPASRQKDALATE